MTDMKRIFLTILVIYCSPLMLLAQIGKEVGTRFPARIVCRIYEISSQAELSASTQQELGLYFERQDSLANISLLRGEPISKVLNFFQLQQNDIKKILSPLEFNDYKSSSSRLRAVVKSRKKLALNDSQIQSLLKQSEVVEDSSGKEGFDAVKKENLVMKAILSTDQCKQSFFETSVSRASQSSLSDLAELMKNGLSNVSDSLRLYNILYPYHLNRLGTLEYLWAMADRQEHDRSKSLIELNKPAILYRLEAYKYAYPWSRFLNVVYYRKELGLNEKQIDTILSQHKLLKQREFNIKFNQASSAFNARADENRQLLTILSLKQFNTYLQITSQDKALSYSKDDFETLKKYKLVAGQDSLKVNKELADYHLRLLLASEWIAIENSKKNAFAKQDILDNKPEVLKKLEEVIRLEAANKIIRF